MNEHPQITAVEARVAMAVGNVLVNDSRGECLLLATDEQCMEIARAAIDAMPDPAQFDDNQDPFKLHYPKEPRR